MKDNRFILPAVKGGRCWNGAHRDSGQIVHGIITTDGKIPNGYWGGKALCGTEPGLRGYGWSHIPEKEINCTKCVKKIKNDSLEKIKNGI